MTDQERMKVFRRLILWLIGFFPLLAVVMFLPAGIGWWKGWLFLAVFFIQNVIAVLYVWRTNPEVVIARTEIHKGTRGWGTA
jgi:uncharacterized membrane protein (DUF485 family)